MRAALLGLGIVTITAIAACDKDTTGNGNGNGIDLPCDVSNVFIRNCHQCHGPTPMYGAPMSLVTYEDLHRPARLTPNKSVYVRVGERTHSDSSPMPPAPYPRLGAADQAVLDQWIAAGAPSGDGSACEPPGPGPGPTTEPLTCQANVHIRPASPFTMPANQPDVYVCYGVDITTLNKRHLVGFGPKIDNAKILHHLFLFQTDTSMSPTPTPCSPFLGALWRTIGAWAPGVGNFYLPPEAGFVDQGTTHWVMQIHYHNFGDQEGQTDASGYDICATDQLRPNDADMMFLGTQAITIPPQTKTTTACDWPVLPPTPSFRMFAAFPHMHLLGLHIGSDLMPQLGTGMPSEIVKVPHYAYEYQQIYPVKADVRANDTVRTTCAWNNTRAQPVTFGTASTDEMCYNMVFYYPKITTPGWNYFTPTQLSTCMNTIEPAQ